MAYWAARLTRPPVCELTLEYVFGRQNRTASGVIPWETGRRSVSVGHAMHPPPTRLPPSPRGPHGAVGLSSSRLGDLSSTREQNACQAVVWVLRPCGVRDWRAAEARGGAPPLRRKVTGVTPPWGAGPGSAGPPAAATPVAGATNVAGVRRALTTYPRPCTAG
jgi:hypothetical protein